MAEPAAPPLGEAAEAQIRALGAAEIVIGIPTFNTARTVGQVVRAASVGLAKYFPESRALIVVSDGGSTDGTITNSVAYPLTRALYGKRIRQPIGGDFGLSGALAARFLKECTGCIELLHNVIGKMIRCARETKRDRMPFDACPLRDDAWFGPLAA